MSPTPPRRPESEFLASLADELCHSPSDSAARQHVGRAATTALSARRAYQRETTRIAALALSLTVFVSTGGIALAGGLPHEMQGMVADAARLLPVPIPVPYPAAPATTLPQDDPILEELERVEVAPSSTPTDSKPATDNPDLVPSSEVSERIDQTGHRDRGVLDDDRWHEREDRREGDDESWGNERNRREDREDRDADRDDGGESRDEGWGDARDGDRDHTSWGERDGRSDHRERQDSNDRRRDDDRS